MLTEKYDFRITDQMTIPLRPHWIANDSYREKCKMLVLNRSKGEIHKVDFSKLTDYIKEGDVICFNDSTIINHMFICKTRQNRLIKIVLEGFLPNNRVIISGLLKERLNANDVFYLVDNPEISTRPPVTRLMNFRRALSARDPDSGFYHEASDSFLAKNQTVNFLQIFQRQRGAKITVVLPDYSAA